jgi:hypothetical protein
MTSDSLNLGGIGPRGRSRSLVSAICLYASGRSEAKEYALQGDAYPEKRLCQRTKNKE